jgi:indole-3-glycerol phosphate synthase
MSVLAKILATKQEEVAAARTQRPLATLEAAARAQGPTRGLAAALRRPAGQRVRVLAEIKRASPSAGAIRKGADPVEIARAYEAGGAAAISVLTDVQYFDGDLAFLGRCRDAVSLPLLRKDFIIDAYQVVEARAAGADAILLIVAALEPAQLAELHAAARQYGLDVLVEVHSLAEAEVARELGATLVGVNHRDLRTFTVDMTLSRQIAPLFSSGAVLVGESGIKTIRDAQLVDFPQLDALLIGEMFMRAPSPEIVLRELTLALQGRP